MDVKVKQRLIGALVLGALAVIFVPMIVLGPVPEGAADAASVPITPPDAPQGEFITREIPLGPQLLPSAVPGVIPAPAGDPNALATVDATATVAPRVDALDADAAVAVDAVTGEPAAAPTAAAPVAPTPAAAPAPALAPAPTPMPAAVAAGGYLVNAGSFGNRANAEALLSRLRAAGLAARSEPVDINGQSGTRISVGPFDTRAAAEAARVRTAAMSGSASVSASDATPSATARPSAASAAPAASGFAVQLGAFSSETEAQALVARAQGEGFAAFQQRTPTASGVLWRVRLGPAVDRAAAELMKSDAAGKLGVSGIIVPHP